MNHAIKTYRTLICMVALWTEVYILFIKIINSQFGHLLMYINLHTKYV